MHDIFPIAAFEYQQLISEQSNPFNHFNINYDPKEFLRDALNTSPNSFVTFGGQKMETFDQWDGIKLEE